MPIPAPTSLLHSSRLLHTGAPHSGTLLLPTAQALGLSQGLLFLFFAPQLRAGVTASERKGGRREQNRPCRLGGDGCDALEGTALAAGTGQLQQWGLGVLLGPPKAPGTALGCCHQQQKSRRLQAWQGMPGLLVGL